MKSESNPNDLRIGAVVWGCIDVLREVDFWSKALDYKLKGEASEWWAILVPKSGEGLQFSLNKVSSPHARRHHLDLFCENKEKEAERLISLGASLKPGWDYPEGADYIVLLDPDGNPFCVVEK